MDSDEIKKTIDDVGDALLECTTILMITEGNIYRDQKLMDCDLVIAVGEVGSPISNKEYQLQISLVHNKKMWIKEDEVQMCVATNFREVDDRLGEN